MQKCLRLESFVALLVFSLPACSRPELPRLLLDDETAVAMELSRELILIDTHIDVPYRLQEKWENISERSGGDFDYPRAIQGGLDLAFMSICVPAEYQETGGAFDLANELIDMVEGFENRWPDRFELVGSVDEVLSGVRPDRILLALGIENGAAIEGDLSNLSHFHARGIRYITLTHAKANQICDSSYDQNRKWSGLSDFGRQVVAEMNRLGIMVDVSHVSDEAFSQILEVSAAPVVASHSSCRSFTPGWERNMSDRMIRSLAARGGVIQINFGSDFINGEYQRASALARRQVREQLARENLDENSSEGQEYVRRYLAENPPNRATVSEVADHIDHVVRLVGVDHVGFGSDFDGVGDSLPIGLEDVSSYPNLISELIRRGYGKEEIAKICSKNLLRVWSEVEQTAAELQTAAVQ